MKKQRAAISALVAAMSLATAAQAQDGAIWVHCEPAGGQTYTLPYMSGTMQVGAGTWRLYDRSRQQLGINQCESSYERIVKISCELSADEFTYELNLGDSVFKAAIDRRTGRGFHRETAPSGGIDHQDYICRGTSDPRPAVQF